jgi:hypothetical protein
MSKNVLSDVVPPSRRSIRQVSRKAEDVQNEHVDFEDTFKVHRGETEPEYLHPHKSEDSEYEEAPIPRVQPSRIDHIPQSQSSFTHHPMHTIEFEPEEEKRHFRTTVLIWTGCVALLVAAFFVVTTYLSGATVTYTPKTKETPINVTLSAEKNTSTGLSFEIATADEVASQPVIASGEKIIHQKARGTATLYNTMSSDQPLVATTRLQSPDGLIFRITKSVVVPKRKSTEPGSVSVAVVADQAGEGYNIGATEFTIPGLKTNPARYSAVSARSTSPMTGGYSGSQPVVTAADRASAERKNIEFLKERLLLKAKNTTPNNLALYSDSAIFDFSASTVLPLKNASASSTVPGANAVVQTKGTLRAVMLDRAQLTAAITRKALPELTELNVEIPQLDLLQFVLETSPQTFWQKNLITFTLKGQGTVTSIVNTVTLREVLAGKKVSSIPEVLKSFPGISKAEAVVRPFWALTLPSEPSDIELKLVK